MSALEQDALPVTLELCGKEGTAPEFLKFASERDAANAARERWPHLDAYPYAEPLVSDKLVIIVWSDAAAAKRSCRPVAIVRGPSLGDRDAWMPT